MAKTIEIVERINSHANSWERDDALDAREPTEEARFWRETALTIEALAKALEPLLEHEPVADAIGIRSAAVDQTGGVTSPDYVMVPREPTEEMLRAGLVGVEEPAAPLVGMRRLSNAYRAMLSAAPPSAPSGEPVAWKWRWNDGQTWMLSESEPDDDGLRVIEPFYLRPSPTRDETIEMCAKVADDNACQSGAFGGEIWIAQRIAKFIRALKSTPDAEGE